MAGESPFKKIPLEPVTSTNLSAFGYDGERRMIAVQFKQTGVIFHYGGASLALATAFYTAESKGKFYAANIRNKLLGQRVTGPCPKCGDEGYVGETCGDCGTAEYRAVDYVHKQEGQDGAV